MTSMKSNLLTVLRLGISALKNSLYIKGGLKTLLKERILLLYLHANCKLRTHYVGWKGEAVNTHGHF